MALEEKIDALIAKLDHTDERLTIVCDQIIGLTSAVNNTIADVREAIGTANLAGNIAQETAARLEQAVEEFRASVTVLGGVKEASGSAIDMATKAIALGETATKIAARTYDMTKQIANHLGLELVDEADQSPDLELLSSSR